MSGAKPKVAMYWCASCGGCDETLLDVDGLLELLAQIELTLWPAALDFKYADLHALADGELTLALINGAIRTSEQEELAHVLRAKAQLVVAFGACAAWGGVPALANLTSRQAIIERAYLSSPTVENPQGVLPCAHSMVDGHALELPTLHETVHCLADVVSVDYLIPGCPPSPATVKSALLALLGDDPPPRGSVLGETRSLCISCDRNASKPEQVTLPGLRRVVDAEVEPQTCLLAQGFLCLGPATRDGCGQSCIGANMPCTGCYGPVDARLEQGAKMVATLGGLLPDEGALAAALAGLVDPAGSLYRYTLSTSLLGSERKEDA